MNRVKRKISPRGPWSNRRLRLEIARLKRRLLYLEGQVARLGRDLPSALNLRGLRVHRSVPEERLLVHRAMRREEVDEFYRLLHRYSFRLWLRDLIRLREGFGPSDLATYCSTNASARYLEKAKEFSLVEIKEDGRWRLARTGVTSFGETLEWFVAEVLRREFHAQVVHGVSFRSPPPGGDFDVLALLEGLLVYVECKSSPPRGIEVEQIASFLGRCRVLLPHVALFLVDTHLRMLDKIVPIFEELLGGSTRDQGGAGKLVERLKGEIFHVSHSIYILNTGRLVVENIRSCIRDFLENRTSASRYITPPEILCYHL